MEFHSIFQNPLPILQEAPFSFINLRNIHVLAAKTLLTILLPFFRICVLFNFFSLFAKQNSEKYWKTSLEMEIHVDFAHFLPPFFRGWKLFFGGPANGIRNVAVATPLALSREKWAPTIWIKIFLIYETCQPFIKRLF